ncbi:cytochrome P450 hydroxylase [Rhizocola hellebori]|uniref:Cytochrome P450 hydroxylase n=1 Tax=Rhizocola hellebori TaxID=1392758 RepID=A0A8J3Q8V4_9ACTN|nr:cytochrome P450 [Rhizocola hellebori]GIH06303.1 cytochrome P450 hydroxylase [Rhizocola hellebori]
MVDVPEGLLRARHRDPYPYFEWLREHAPLLREDKPSGLTVWHVSRYADVRSLLSDTRLSKRPDLLPAYVAGPAGLNEHLVHADPPEHTRLRALVNTAFIPRRIAALEPLIHDTAAGLLAQFADSGVADLIEDFAMPLTFTLICTILGVPAEGNTARTREVLAHTVNPVASSAQRAAHERELLDYLVALVAHKRRAGPVAEADLLGALIAASDEGGTLSESELVGTAYLLLLVGHDTTVNLIGNGMLALLRHPHELQRLRDNPGLMPTAIEELLRYDSPVRDATFRVCVKPIELAHGLISPGAIVSLLIGSANHDWDQFDSPGRLDLSRSPNEHLAFGRGPHFCIGAALARMEGAIAFRLLLDRFGDIGLAVPPQDLAWRPSRVMRGLYRLPVLVG